MFKRRVFNFNQLCREAFSKICYLFWYVTIWEFFLSSRATVSALAIVTGATNRFLENTLIPVRTNLYTGDFIGPTITTCIMPFGKHRNDEIGLSIKKRQSSRQSSHS